MNRPYDEITFLPEFVPLAAPVFSISNPSITGIIPRNGCFFENLGHIFHKISYRIDIFM